MTGCILGSQYIPSIEYFAHWKHHGKVVMEMNEHFQKRTWRNKTAIVGPDLPLVLTVPLQKGKHQQMMIRDVRIAYHDSWPKHHMNSLKAAYGKTAFFEEVSQGIEMIYQSTPVTLWELNMSVINFITSMIPNDWKLEMTTSYEVSYPLSVMDLRGGIPAGISIHTDKPPPIYGQVHRIQKSHQPNLCILDALCHLGPETNTYLARYASNLYATL